MGKELREFRASSRRARPGRPAHRRLHRAPFIVIVVVPWATGKALTSDQTVSQQVIAARAQRDAGSRGAAARGRYGRSFLFQQFLLLYLIAPIVGAVSLAALYPSRRREAGADARAAADDADVDGGDPDREAVLASFLPSLAIEAIGLCSVRRCDRRGGVARACCGRCCRSAACSWSACWGRSRSLAALQATIAVLVPRQRSAQRPAGGGPRDPAADRHAGRADGRRLLRDDARPVPARVRRG